MWPLFSFFLLSLTPLHAGLCHRFSSFATVLTEGRAEQIGLWASRRMDAGGKNIGLDYVGGAASATGSGAVVCPASLVASAPAVRGEEEEEEQEEDLHRGALTCNDRLHQCSSEPAGDPNTKTHTHTHEHTPLLSVRSADAARSHICNSFLPWQASTEHRKAAQPAGAQPEPDRRGCQRGKGSKLKVVIESALPLTAFETVNLSTCF